jgi:hypothetical protein
MQIWLIDTCMGSPVNVAPDEHDAIAWFTEGAFGERSLAHDSYLAIFSKGRNDMGHHHVAPCPAHGPWHTTASQGGNRTDCWTWPNLTPLGLEPFCSYVRGPLRCCNAPPWRP